MRIAFTNDSLYGYAYGNPSKVGGAERQQWLLARALAASGWSVAVGVRQALREGERHEVDGVEFVGVGRGQILAAWYRWLRLVRPAWWYWRCADHMLGPGVEIARHLGVRTVFAAAFDADVDPRRALVRRRRWWPLYAWGLDRTDRILVQHRQQLSALRARWHAKTFIVPSLAGSETVVRPHADRRRAVAWVGMLQHSKRPDVLFEIAKATPDVQYIVCGGVSTHRSPPGYSNRVLASLRALPNVEYRGQTRPDEARIVIGDAAILLSTSDGEGFPNTFLEAWLGGTPVVSLKIDPEGALARRQLGIVSGNAERAVRDIRVLLDSVAQREAIAVRARQYAADAHSDGVVVAAFEQALRDGRDAQTGAPQVCSSLGA